MRRLLVPTCLFLSAWAHPAGPVFEISREEPIVNTTVIEKTAQAVGPAATAAAPGAAAEAPPAETTEQVLIFSGDSIGETNVNAGESAETPPEPKVETVRLPPRRAIPHHVVCEALASAAADYDLPAPFFIRLIWQESGFNQNAVSRAGAQGVAQFMPAVAQSMQLSDPFNPLAALRTSAQLLRDLFKQFGNLGLAAAAYNAGPKRVQNWLDKHGKLPQETRDYVERITGRAADQWKAKKVAMHMHVPARAPCQREAGLFAADGPAKIPMPPARQDIKNIDQETHQLVANAGKHRKHGRIRVASADPSSEVTAPAEAKPASQPESKHQAKREAKHEAKHEAKRAAKHEAKRDKQGPGKPLQLVGRRNPGAKIQGAPKGHKKRPAQLALNGHAHK